MDQGTPGGYGGTPDGPLREQMRYDEINFGQDSKREQPKQPKQPGYFLNKSVVITGASSGIGRTLAYWYLNNGAKVALVARDIDELDNIGKNFPSQALVV